MISSILIFTFMYGDSSSGGQQQVDFFNKKNKTWVGGKLV
jgi:hypothetical protein